MMVSVFCGIWQLGSEMSAAHEQKPWHVHDYTTFILTCQGMLSVTRFDQSPLPI